MIGEPGVIPLAEILEGERCQGCGRPLAQSAILVLGGGVEWRGCVLYPAVCACGTITVVGGGACLARQDGAP